MRIQVSILAIALGCALVAVTALVAERRTPRASGGDRPRPAGAVPEEPDERAPAAVAEALIAPEVALAPVPAELASRRPSREEAGEPLCSTIDEELQRARDLGIVDDLRLAEFLARLQVERGEPRRALELLRKYRSRDADLWRMVVQAFVGTSDSMGQRDAVLAALELMQDSQEWTDLLIQVDQGLAVSRLQLQLARAAPEDRGEARARLADALVRCGRSSEARVLVAAMLAEQPDDDRAILILMAVDPMQAIAHVERLLPSGSSEEDARQTLVDLWTGMGNVSGAEELLERLAGEGHAIGAEEWGQVAEAWMSTGENERARATFLRA